MIRCIFCNTEMIWASNDTFEDCGIPGEGIVVSYSCPKCNASADFYSNIEDLKVDINKENIIKEDNV